MAEQDVAVSIVVPVYNEAGTLAELCAGIVQALQDRYRFEILLVNDGSTDDSGRIADELASRDGRIAVLHFARNFGQTAALMAGFDHSVGRIVVPIDADLQNDPADIPALIAQIDAGADVCSGWRRQRQDNTLLRIVPSVVANRLISLISGVRLNDYGCTLKAYRREILKDVRLYGEMHRFVPIYATWQGAKVVEIQVRHHPRRHGRSKYGLGRIGKVLLDLLVVKFLADYSQKPIYLFGGFGLLNLALATGAFGLMIYFKFWGGKTFIQTPLPQLVVLLVLVGFLSILMGLLAELNVRTYYESQGKATYKVARIVRPKSI